MLTYLYILLAWIIVPLPFAILLGKHLKRMNHDG